MAAPNALPMSSAEGAAHPRAWNEALPLAAALEPEPVELELVAADCWLAPVLPVVLELFEPPPLQAARIITTMPPIANPAALVPMGWEVTPLGQFAQRNITSRC
jgi:hypothetical protein